MHPSVYEWVARVAADVSASDVLEVGSYNVNGTVRDHFTGVYVGCDITKGPGVDTVADAETLPWEDASWPVVVSTEMLEHCPRPWVAVAEMARVLAPAGRLLLTARGYDERGCWEVHGYPHDYWRFSELAMRLLVEDAGLSVTECVKDPEGPGWMIAAVKP